MWRVLAVWCGLAACSFRPGGAAGDAPGSSDVAAQDARSTDAAPGDAAGPDASSPDAASPDAAAAVTPPSRTMEAHAHTLGASPMALSYALAIPAGAQRYLLVSVQIGANCGDNPTAATTSVTYAGIALTRIAQVTGTPACDVAATRSEQWGLVAPPSSGTVAITLAGPVKTIHSGALAFAGVDPANPVRGSVALAGAGTTSSLAIASALDELVVNTVGQGTGISAPGAAQTAAFIQNATTHNTLDNSAASTAPGAAVVTMTWTFGGIDEWQSISTSLRP